MQISFGDSDSESERSSSPLSIDRIDTSVFKDERITHKNDRAKYICSCGSNRGANYCTCSECYKRLRGGKSRCGYFGSCIEPLAWNLEGEEVGAQTQSPLFTKLPEELRDMIFEYSLTSSRSIGSEHDSHIYAAIRGHCLIDQIAVNLLCTCRAVYLETWDLPLSLNPHYVEAWIYEEEDDDDKFLPWQLALISSLDITLHQESLEGEWLRDWFENSDYFAPKLRHDGVYVAPSGYQVSSNFYSLEDLEIVGSNDCSLEIKRSFDCSLIPAGDEQERISFSMALSKEICFTNTDKPPRPSAMRLMKARPLVHLTLRLQYDNWWTLDSHPDIKDDNEHLGLDPSIGIGSARVESRPTSSRMRELAKQRRAGEHPEIKDGQGWANVIAQLPDLKTLELVLESFRAKLQQLNSVVEAAKTWKFPIRDTGFELIWAGDVESRSYTNYRHYAMSDWDVKPFEVEVRVVRFVRRVAV